MGANSTIPLHNVCDAFVHDLSEGTLGSTGASERCQDILRLALTASYAPGPDLFGSQVARSIALAMLAIQYSYHGPDVLIACAVG